MIINPNDIANKIRQDTDHYRKERMEELKRDINLYRDKRKDNTQIMIQRELLIKEMVIANGDEVNDKFIKYMETIKPSSSSLSQFMKVDIPDVARKIVNEEVTVQDDSFNNDELIKDKLRLVNDKIELLYEDIQDSEGIYNNIKDGICKINLNKQQYDKDIVSVRKGILDTVVTGFDTLWYIMPIDDNTAHHCINKANEDDVLKPDAFLKKIRNCLERVSEGKDNKPHRDVDNKAIPGAMYEAAIEYRKNSDKLKMDIITRAKRAAAVINGKKVGVVVGSSSRQQPIQLGRSNIIFKPFITSNNIITYDVEYKLKCMANGMMNGLSKVNNNVDDDKECRYILTYILMDTLIGIRQVLISSPYRHHHHKVDYINKNTNLEGRDDNKITTTQALYYSLSLLKASIMWRVKLSMIMLWQIYNNGSSTCRRVVGSELESVILDEESKRCLRRRTTTTRRMMMTSDDDNGDD